MTTKSRKSRTAPVDPVRAAEDAAIDAAMAILTKRLKREGASLCNPADAGSYCRIQLAQQDREHFGVLFLDTRHRVIAWEVLFTGTVDACDVNPREVVRAAMRHNAAAAILAHNHPSGDTEPSAADRAITARLKQSLSLVEVRLLDHFVVGAGVTVSLAARGWV